MLLMLILFCIYVAFICIGYFNQGEFSNRHSEIVTTYKETRKYIIKNSIWNEPIIWTTPNNFYRLEFSTSSELVTYITYMIEDAITCYKKQNFLGKFITSRMLSDLDIIQEELAYIKVYTIH